MTITCNCGDSWRRDHDGDWTTSGGHHATYCRFSSWHERHSDVVRLALTPSDLARLLVRIDDMPGFDPTGLEVRSVTSGQAGGHVPYTYEDWQKAPALQVVRNWQGGYLGFSSWNEETPAMLEPLRLGTPDGPVFDHYGVNLADSATADRVARYIDRHPRCTAVCFGWAPSLRGWVLHTWLPDHDGRVFYDFEVHALNDLRPLDDDRRLPDGSRWVDRCALAEVARHVGRTLITKAEPDHDDDSFYDEEASS